MKKTLSFMLIIFMVIGIMPLELFAANELVTSEGKLTVYNQGVAIQRIDINVNSVEVGEKAPTSIYNSSQSYDITQVEWSCLYDNSFKAGDVFKEDSTYYLTFHVKAKAGYYIPIYEETGEFYGSYLIRGDYTSKACYMEGDEFVVKCKFVTRNVMNNIYINIDYSKWTWFASGVAADSAKEQFFETVFSIPEQYEESYYVDETCCEIKYENSQGVCESLEYGHVLSDNYNYYMEYWVEALSGYDFNSDASKINVYINGVKVETKKIEYDKSYDAYIIDVRIDFKKEAELKANISSNKTTFNVGEKITIKSSATGGSGNYTYKYSVLNVDTGKWSVLQDFTTSDTYIYTLNYPGKKQFAVSVKDSSGNTVAANRIDVNVLAPLSAVVKVDNSTTSLTKVLGSKITLNVSATGGSGNYTYKYAVLNIDTGKWSVLKDFSTTSTYAYSLNYLGKKQFAVTVKDSAGKTVAANRITVNVVNSTDTLKGTLKYNGSTAALTKQVGSQIKLEASATGGAGSYKYKFAVLNVDTGKWSVLKDFTTTSTYTYALNYPGKKEFAVTVKDGSGKTIATNRLTVNVVSSVVNNLSVDLLVNGISSSSTVKVGGEIKLIPTVKGGTGNYKYKYVVHNVDNDTWYTLKDYSTDTSYSLKPSSIGKKEFVVSVKDNNGNVVSSSRFGVTVIN